ncbi:MAG: MAB_1171c family putative transporter, partial [Acidimicrobiia bacterium]
MLYHVLAWTCMLGALAAFAYKLPMLLRNKVDPALMALSSYFLLSFASFFLELDAVWPRIAGVFGNVYAVMIISDSAVILLTAAQQIVLVYWSYPPREARPKVRRRFFIFGGLLLSVVGIFYWAQPSTRFEKAETANVLNMHNLRFAAYLACVTAVVAVGQLVTMRLCLRYAGMISRSWLRLGMRAVVAGSVFILIYCAMRLVTIIGVQSGADMVAWEPVRWLAGDIGSLLELIGWTIPGWGPALSTGHQW